jgi:alanyl-tRNA synthetase
MEIWNLVFMQFERHEENGQLVTANLPKPCVDTGAGLERVTAVLSGKTSNYDTDGLRALVDEAARLSGKAYTGTQGDDDVSMRVIADHARTTAFLIAEGVFPDRATREYVLRRVMRRAVRHGHRLGIAKPFLHEVAVRATELMGDVYPELVRRRELIASVTEQEEVRFRETIDRGLKMLDEEIQTLRAQGNTTIRGETAFRLYDTFGFPLDLTEVIARERNLAVDSAGYDTALALQQKKSQGSKLAEDAVSDVYRALVAGADGQPLEFLGYDEECAQGELVAIVRNGAQVQQASAGESVELVFQRTPFYGESGGQVGDCGRVFSDACSAQVTDTQKPLAGLIVHHARVTQGELTVGMQLTLEVDAAARTATRRNHSATHLLHWALRTVLGEQSVQKGSLVGPDRLRFDFSHGRPVTTEELAKIEDLVNAKILQNAPVITEVLPIELARSRGAVAIFEEKYGDVVRVLTMTPDSVELCGGTHARATGDLGLFTILSEGGVAAGVRRIEAATGLNAIAHLRHVVSTLDRASKLLKSSRDEVPERIERLAESGRVLDKELHDLKRKTAMSGLGGGGAGASGGHDLTATARTVGDVKVLAVRMDGLDAALQRETAEKLRDKLGESAVLVASVNGDKVALVVCVSKTASARYRAGDLVKTVALVVGGSGGGRPDMAQAGGTDVTQVDAAMERFYACFSS